MRQNQHAGLLVQLAGPMTRCLQAAGLVGAWAHTSILPDVFLTGHLSKEPPTNHKQSNSTRKTGLVKPLSGTQQSKQTI